MNPLDRRVGLIYSENMCKHYATDDRDHPECPNRIRVIWERLNSRGLLQRSIILNAKVATDSHIALVHNQIHINLIKNISSRPIHSRRQTANSFNSVYFSEGSSKAAYLAAGSVIEVADKVAKGELDSAFAIVRPPGHHAETDKPMGFCLYNNVGIAASFLLNERRDLGIRKILIVDWDVHHGNGTQKMFYNDPRVLFFSVHRHNFGTFYPVSNDGSYIKTGTGPGEGFNINVPWEHGGCGDVDYLAVWNYILIPVAKEFNPDMILISAGFDAAVNDPLGGCCVTPSGFSILLKKLMESVGGKIVMALEGGYNLNSLAESVQKCVSVLLGDPPIMEPSIAYPYESTIRVIQQVRHVLSLHWPILASRLPEEAIRTMKTYIPSSDSDSESETGPPKPTAFEEDETLKDVTQILSSLEINRVTKDQASTTVPSLGVELQNVYVWYASFGSNMRTDRFLCYIEGGQIEGMKKPCVGSIDKSKPKEIIWKTYQHRLFFARDGTATWGSGGVAFLHPQSNANEKTFMCLYKITLQQFNDVLLQENGLSYKTSPPIFDKTALQNIQSEGSITMEALGGGGWYRNVVYLGIKKEIPVLTMTCTLSDIETFKSGKVPINPPCKEYANTLIKGLVDGKQLSEEDAFAYIQEASTKPL